MAEGITVLFHNKRLEQRVDARMFGLLWRRSNGSMAAESLTGDE